MGCVGEKQPGRIIGMILVEALKNIGSNYLEFGPAVGIRIWVNSNESNSRHVQTGKQW